jgi:rRNA maturation endonuclease Nob1
MTSNCYIIDTSSLIELNKNNPMDVYPGVWAKIEQLINSNRLVAPKEVFNEIEQTDDSLSAWSKTQSKMFIEPTKRQIKIVKDILDIYPSLIKIDRRYDADPWVIALARDLIDNPQQTLQTPL